jgi:endonuclease III related protein
LFAQPPEVARTQLLEIRGVGPETADAILLYAGKQPFFVADSYTRRVLARHNLIPLEENYPAAQSFLHRHLPADEGLFNEFHALLVETGKRYCKRHAAECRGCPLEPFLPSHGGAQTLQRVRVPGSRARFGIYPQREAYVKAHGSE